MIDQKWVMDGGLMFYPYTARFLLEGPQLEVTVAASPVLGNDEEPRRVAVDLNRYPAHDVITLDLDVDELEAFGRALISCAKSISLTPEEVAVHLKHESDRTLNTDDEEEQE